MKKYLIKIAKKNELLYRIAKRFYRTIRPAAPTLYRSADYLVVYRAAQPQDIAMIRQHYEGLRKENTRVVVLWEGEPLVLHSLMRRYQGMIFLSLDYYERYQKKLMHRQYDPAGLASAGTEDFGIHIVGSDECVF